MRTTGYLVQFSSGVVTFDLVTIDVVTDVVADVVTLDFELPNFDAPTKTLKVLKSPLPWNQY